MTQRRMDFTADELLPRDSHVTAPAEIARLASQSLKILERLHRGPASNHELAQISLKYTSRISDLRAAGCVVTCERKSGGGAVYTLQQDETTRKMLKG